MSDDLNSQDISEPPDEGLGGHSVLNISERLIHSRMVSDYHANVSSSTDQQCPLGGSDPWTPFLVTLQIIIFFLTIVGNCTILYLLAKHPSLHQAKKRLSNFEREREKGSQNQNSVKIYHALVRLFGSKKKLLPQNGQYLFLYLNHSLHVTFHIATGLAT